MSAGIIPWLWLDCASRRDGIFQGTGITSSCDPHPCQAWLHGMCPLHGRSLIVIMAVQVTRCLYATCCLQPMIKVAAEAEKHCACSYIWLVHLQHAQHNPQQAGDTTSVIVSASSQLLACLIGAQAECPFATDQVSLTCKLHWEMARRAQLKMTRQRRVKYNAMQFWIVHLYPNLFCRNVGERSQSGKQATVQAQEASTAGSRHCGTSHSNGWGAISGNSAT